MKFATMRPTLLARALCAATARGAGLLGLRSTRLTAHEDEHEYQGERGADDPRRKPPEKTTQEGIGGGDDGGHPCPPEGVAEFCGGAQDTRGEAPLSLSDASRCGDGQGDRG